MASRRGKVGALADVHVGNHQVFGGPVTAGLNVRCRMAVDVLARAVLTSAERGCDATLVVGDLFDVADATPATVRAVGDALAAGGAGHEVVLVVGNHDAQGPGEHAMLPLAWVPGVRVVETDAVVELGCGARVACLPTDLDADRRLGGPVARLRRLVEAEGAVDVLALHYGVSDDKTAPWLRGASDSLAAADLEAAVDEGLARCVVAGNWHDRRTWRQMTVVQVGSLVPTGFDDTSPEHGLSILDPGRGEVGRVEVPGPRFLSVRVDEVQATVPAIRALAKEGCRVGVQVTAPPDRLAEAREACDRLRAEENLLGARAVADRREAGRRVRKAARRVGGATTLDEAIGRFLQASPPDGVSAEAVAAQCKDYVRRAGAGE